MKIKVFLTVVLLLTLSGIYADSQDLKSATGIVTSFRTIPLKHVTVTSLKAGETVFTDSTGTFSVKCFAKDVLRISASGFVERKQNVKSGSTYKIDLVYVDNVRNFNDAVSHGHITGEVLRDAIFKESQKNVKDYSKYKTIYELIASEIYNVKVTGTTILNKKIKSMDRSPQVLLVVDDRIVSDISFVIPNDVKSVEFLDDVETVMYGSKGANGVLKITLK